jgi:hypothetical protein
MCAFIDELVDVFGDDAEFGTGAYKGVHPYLLKASPEVADKPRHEKLGLQIATDDSQDEVVAPPAETVLSPSRPRPYLPSPSHRHYLPLPKSSEQLAEASRQEKCEVVSDVAVPVDGEKDISATTEGKAKPFRRPNSSVHLYLFEAEDSDLESVDSTAVPEDPLSRQVSGESTVEKKLDIDALIRALPPKEAEPETIVTHYITTQQVSPKDVWEANPELKARMAEFLCHETKLGYDVLTHDMHFRVAAR